MKNFIICVLIVLCVLMFTGAWRGGFTNPFWDDMVFKKNVTVTATLKTDGVILGSSGEGIDFTSTYLKLWSGSGGAIYFNFPANAMTFNSAAFVTTTDNQADLGSAGMRWKNLYSYKLDIDSILYTSGDSLFGDTNAIWDLRDISKILFPSGDYQFDVLYPTQPHFGSIGKSDTTYAYGYIDTLKVDSINTRIAVVSDTLTYYNSNQILFKVIIQDSILTITQDAFTSFKFEKQELNTDTDYFLFAPANDSTKMVIKKAGYYKFKAKYAYDNNSGASVTDLLVAGRLTVNSKELLCSQILRQCEMKNATSRVLATSGFFNASVNDTIRFEYYSSDPNIDFHTNSVFDSLFAVGMSLEYMK